MPKLNGRHLAGALRAVELGYRVLPVDASKKATLSNWQHLATDDPNQVRAWASTRPGGMWAVLTDGLVVVDLDPGSKNRQDPSKNTQDGWAWPRAAELGGTRVHTPRGGRHHWFRQLPGRPVRNSASNLAPGYAADVRGDGGYAVLPGQVNAAGGRYDGQLPPLAELEQVPEWVVAATEAPRATSKALTGIRIPSSRSKGGDGPGEPLVPGSRDDELHRRACGWRAFEVPIEQAYEWAHRLQRQQEADYPQADPFTPEQARKCVDSAYKHPPGLSPDYQAKINQRGTSDDGDTFEGLTVAERCVALALRDFDLARSDDSVPIAIPRVGARHAVQLRGRGGLSQRLGALHLREFRKLANKNALSDAIHTLEGLAHEQPEVQTWIRSARPAGGVIELDLGDETGRAIRIDSAGWQVVDRSGEVFARSPLTGAYPLPERGGKVDLLRELVNVSDRDWNQLVAWMVASLIPDIPHAVLLLAGEQGTGKSDCTEMLVNLVDPSPAPKRAAPRDEKQWHTAAAGSYVVGLDNLSTIPFWLSDAICRAVTGDANVVRELFTNSGIEVQRYRRVVLMNGIGLTALRGDLADRLMRIELKVIERSARREHAVLMRRYEQIRPAVLGGLLNLLSEVLAVQQAGGVQLDELPRLADFARVVAAVDKVRNSDALGSFVAGQAQVFAEVAGDDPVTGALEELLSRRGGRWTGTSAQLVNQLRAPAVQPPGWPTTASRMTPHLNRLAPALRPQGWTVDKSEQRTKAGFPWLLALPGYAPEPTLPEPGEVV
jgi:hypothetical protein